MMKKNKMKPIKLNSIFTALCIFVFICSACERTVEIDLEEHTPRLTVNSLFSPDSMIIVALSNSIGALSDSNINYISGANIELYEGDNFIEMLTEKTQNDTFVFDADYIPDTTFIIIGTDTNIIVTFTEVPTEFEVTSTPYYESTIIPQPNVDYKIKAVKSGFADVEAVGNIPANVAARDFDISGAFVEERYYGFEGEEDGYKYIEGNINITVDDPAGEENFYEIKLFTSYEDSIFAYFSEDEEVFLGVQERVSRIYYSNDEGLNSELGLEAEQTVFADVLFDGETKVFRLTNIYGDLGQVSSGNNKLLIEVIAVSKDYYQYQTSTENQSYSDGDPFSEPVFVYSNVENGYGIFAGFQSAKYEVDLDGL